MTLGDERRFPVIETERLLLRPMMPADAPDLLALASDESVVRFMSSPAISGIEEARTIIGRTHELFESGSSIRWGVALKETNRVIGNCGCEIPKDASFRSEFGFMLLPACHRRGYMSEALRAALRYAFESLAANRAEARCLPGNVASMKLLEKLGFTREGVLREQQFFKGEFHDLVMYALLRREYIMQNRGAP